MSRKCDLTGVGVQSGNNVSHSNRHTRRRFLPNLHHVSLLSETLGRKVPLRITAATLRSVDHNGGLDSFLLGSAAAKLTPLGRKLRISIKKAKLSTEKTA